VKILVADDDPVSRRVLELTLRRWEYEVVVTVDGPSAWQTLQTEPVAIALLDWMMPGMDGLELCRRVRATSVLANLYVILVTARSSKADIVAGLDGGADDYVTKPFNREELRARLQVGRRMLALQERLAERVRDLQDTLAQVQQLQGLLPICSYCKKIRDDDNYWQQVETYVAARSAARFSHSICPTCWKSEVEPQLGPGNGEVQNVSQE
jgi:DNA-binding response OmpR family regulator